MGIKENTTEFYMIETTEDIENFRAVSEEEFTSYQYITTVPDELNQYEWYLLCSKAYNLALTGMWFFIATYVIDKIFITFGKFHRRVGNKNGFD